MRFLFVAFLISVPCFSGDWSPRLAADYLDARQKAWFDWPKASANGGPCVSCHTGVTYLLARPALRRALGESQPTAYESGLLAGLRTRLASKDTGKATPQALGVEAILSALFLADGPDARQALDRMWSLQLREGKPKGAWSWFDFDLNPWEIPEAKFYGASLAALAIGGAPSAWRNREGVEELIGYLGSEQAAQALHNRLALLWASTRLGEALPQSARKSIVDEVWRKQQADGGWTNDALGPWKNHEAAPPSVGSNSYATGFATFVLVKAGASSSDPRLTRALAWLRSHQDRQFGYWDADSMNKRYEPDSMPVLFMRDAATAFASLALLEAREPAAKESSLH